MWTGIKGWKPILKQKMNLHRILPQPHDDDEGLEMNAARPNLWEMCPFESSPSRAVYRRRSHPRLGGMILILGLVAGVAILSVDIMEGQTDLGAGAFLLVVSLISGLWMISDQRLVLDKSTMQVTRSWRLLGSGRSATETVIGELESVNWSEKSAIIHRACTGREGMLGVPVMYICSARDDEHPEPQMYDLFTTESKDEARRLAAEVGRFLDLDGVDKPPAPGPE